MWKNYLNKKARFASAVFLCLAVVLCFSCCASIKKKSAGNSASDTEPLPGEPAQAAIKEESTSAPEKSLQAFYDGMLKEVRANFDFSETAVVANPVPGWLRTLADDGAYFYVIGVSPKNTSEQRSRDRALLNAQEKLKDAGMSTRYTHISTYTQKLQDEQDKKYYISAVLVRVPKTK